MALRGTIAALFLLAGLAGRSQSPLFQLLLPKETGIHFVNEIVETENLNILAYEDLYNGGGVAVGDFNNDGLQDLFFTANDKPCKLFINLGNMKFRDATREAGIETRPGGWKTGVTVADVNGDGLPDIYICYAGTNAFLRGNQLFINQGNLHFKEKAAEYGLNDAGFCTQAVFFDYDRDGDLDMFLLRHSIKKVDNLELSRYRDDIDTLSGDELFENRNGHFVDVSHKAGLRQSSITYGLGIVIADVNKDGWPDIYATNDYNEPDYFYINNRNGTFTDETADCFLHLAQFSMGVDIADINNDGLPDIVNLDMLPEDNRRQKLLQLQENYESFTLMTGQGLQKQYMHNMLQLNNGDGTFSEISQLAGISATDWSWCPLMADFDNDGYKDIFITNGYLRDYTNKDFLRYWGDYKIKKALNQEPVKLMDLVQAMPYSQLKKYVYRNNGDLTFTNMQADWGMNQPAVSSGAVYVDLDNDGDLDMVVNNINSEAFVYKNMSSEQQKPSFLQLKLSQTGPNPFAIGAKVYAYANGQLQYQELYPVRGFLSCTSTILNFGFGKNGSVDSLVIIWPDQRRQRIDKPVLNQLLAVRESSDAPPAAPDPVAVSWMAKGGSQSAVFEHVKPLIEYKAEGFGDNDFKRQLLMLFMYSRVGPVMAKADVNKDGLDDLFISGDRQHPGTLFLQRPGGRFGPAATAIGHEDSSSTAAVSFFDANGDGWPDLYVAKGGYSLWEPHTFPLQDELWLNDGKGNLAKAAAALPDLSDAAKSCVRPCDFDGDGDVDLFVGGRLIPGQYPVTPTSYLLVNDGKGKFSIASTPFDHIGMVTDAQWTDLDGDGRKDLVLCGEYMPVMVFLNKANGFVDHTIDFFGAGNKGFWNTLALADLDGDGKLDLVAGNLGLNTRLQLSEKEPAELVYGDFDGNGSIDPFFCYYIQGVSYPFVSRDELNEQIYPMRKKFGSYKDYAGAKLSDILTPEQLKGAGRLTATESKTRCWLRRGDKFVPVDLPVAAQFSMVTKILAQDFDGDGKTDLLLMGNHSDNRLKLGSIDANYGCLLKGDGKGGFDYVHQPQSGLSIKGDVKSAEELRVQQQNYLLVGLSEDQLQFYKVR